VNPCPGSSQRCALEAAERADPFGHAVHVCLAMAWGFLQSVTNAGEAISWGALLAISIARLPRIRSCYRAIWRDPLWWTAVAWAAWWALAGLWGPAAPGRARLVLPERWMLTPLMLWPVMGRPWLVLGAMALGGGVQSASVAVVSWDGSGWLAKQDAPGLSALSQSQWQTVTALVLAACGVRFGPWPIRIPAILVAACSGLAVLVLAVRTMAVAALAGTALGLSRAVRDRRTAILRLAAASACAAVVGAALLAWSPAGEALRASLASAARAAEGGAYVEAAGRASSFRLILARAAIDLGLEHPFLGGGRGSFRAELPGWAERQIAKDPSVAPFFEKILVGTISDAHNALLHAWAEGGIPAAALLAAMLLGLAARLWRQSRTSASACTALALYSIVLVNVPGGIITAKSPGALIAVCLAVSWLGLGYRVAKPIT
jgi:O-antigen ligase